MGLITFSSVPFQLLRSSSLHAVSIMSVAASADGHYGWQVRVMTLAANLMETMAGRFGSRPLLPTLADGNYGGWQVRVMTLILYICSYWQEQSSPRLCEARHQLTLLMHHALEHCTHTQNSN